MMTKTTTATATEIAMEVFNEEFRPALKKMIRSLLESVKQGQATKSAYARFAAVMGLANISVPSAEKVFDSWQGAVADFCRAFVRAGLIDQNDDVFNGFSF